MNDKDAKRKQRRQEANRRYYEKQKRLRSDNPDPESLKTVSDFSDRSESGSERVRQGTPYGGFPLSDDSFKTMPEGNGQDTSQTGLKTVKTLSDGSYPDAVVDVNRRIVRKCEHGWPVDIYGETACDRGCNFSGDLAATNDFDLTELNDFRRDLARYWILRSIADNLDHARYVASLFPSHLVRDALKNRTFNEPRRADYDENGWRLYEEKDTI